MYISYSVFDAYNRCPLKYKYSFIDKVSVPKRSELFFGGLIHDVVKYALKKDPIIPTIKELTQYFKNNWDAEVFANNKEAEQYFELGQSMIRNFHLSLTPGLRNIVATEKRFQIPLSEKHTLTGVIDRIDKLPYGAFEIIDYKTSKSMPTQSEINSDKQLGIYQFAASKMWPEVENIKLTLYFLKHYEQLTTTRRQDEIETLKEEFINTAEKIENETEFKPKLNRFCDWCDYKHLCPLKNQNAKCKSQNDIKKIIKEYIETQKTAKELEAQIHEYFDKEKIKQFSVDKINISRTKKGDLKLDL